MPIGKTLQAILKSLSPIYKGDNVHGVASSERLNAIQDAIRLISRGDHINAGVGIRKRVGHDGSIMLTVDKERTFPKAAEVIETPFKVVKVPKAPTDTSPGDWIGVIGNSHLFNSEDNQTYEEDNFDWGLLQDDVVADDAAQFKPGELGEKIWLQIELADDQSIIAIDIMHGPVGGANWSTYPNPIEINDDDTSNIYQQFYHQIIAEITDQATDPRPGIFLTNENQNEVQVTQLLFENLMMVTAHTTTDSKWPNVPLLVAVPWGMFPGTSLDGEADEINDLTTDAPWLDSGGELITPYSFGTPTEATLPFQVIKIPTSGNSDLIGVNDNSHLFNSEDKDTYEEDNTNWGLVDPADYSGTTFDPGNLGDKIWLRITLDQSDQSITAIDVKHGPASDGDWPGYPDPIDINTDGPPYQQYFHQIIAEITDPSVDPRPGITVINSANQEVQVTQILFNNLMMTTAQTTADADEPGLPLLVAVPWGMYAGTTEDGLADELNSDTPDLMTPWQFSSGALARPFPWAIRFNGTDMTVSVGPGTINSTLPSNIFENLTVNQFGTFYVTLDCNTDGDSITDATIDATPTPPDPIGSGTNAAPDSFSVLLGLVVDGHVFQLIDYLLSANPLATIQTLKESLIPGEPYYDTQYTWSVF